MYNETYDTMYNTHNTIAVVISDDSISQNTQHKSGNNPVMVTLRFVKSVIIISSLLLHTPLLPRTHIIY